ncbi:hypothetical protein [Gymnodinialimonas hymeniacidonis]|uniref:hypothetical protein n=1 Tax=Gymnodinialimonas hymeniacidonis TaxID=3126508 RepID=UPI0034C68593
MAEDTDTTPRPRRRTGWWVLFTFILLWGLQAGFPLYIILSEGVASGFDWAGFIGFSLGLIAIPLLLGCLGLLWRKRPGLGFFIVAFAAFVVLNSANIVAAGQV